MFHLQGKETTLSQVYCPGLVKAILHGVRQTIQYHQPDRFNRRAHQTWANNLVTEPASWTDIFKQLTKTFSASRAKNHVLATSDPLWDAIKQLVGWPRLERVQISSQPTLMRFPAHIVDGLCSLMMAPLKLTVKIWQWLVIPELALPNQSIWQCSSLDKQTHLRNLHNCHHRFQMILNSWSPRTIVTVSVSRKMPS